MIAVQLGALERCFVFKLALKGHQNLPCAIEKIENPPVKSSLKIETNLIWELYFRLYDLILILDRILHSFQDIYKSVFPEHQDWPMSA